MLIFLFSQPVVKLQNNRGNNKYSYTRWHLLLYTMTRTYNRREFSQTAPTECFLLVVLPGTSRLPSRSFTSCLSLFVTSNSDDNLLKNIELFDKLVLRFNGRVLFVKDVLGDEICCWSFYGEGRKIAEVCCTSIVYATEKKQTKVSITRSHTNSLMYVDLWWHRIAILALLVLYQMEQN